MKKVLKVLLISAGVFGFAVIGSKATIWFLSFLGANFITGSTVMNVFAAWLAISMVIVVTMLVLWKKKKPR